MYSNVVTQQSLRIAKLREYLIAQIDTLLNDTNYELNANWLSNDPNNYSLDKIPVQTIENWCILGYSIRRDVYSFRSRMKYSQDTMANLLNTGFFEIFEQLINSNNEEGVLPEIDNIETIQCLNCGTMVQADTNTAEFDIQIEITYRDIKKETTQQSQNDTGLTIPDIDDSEPVPAPGPTPTPGPAPGPSPDDNGTDIDIDFGDDDNGTSIDIDFDEP
jgi:hypothetical protein